MVGCVYRDANEAFVLQTSLFKNADGASMNRALHARAVTERGLEIYVSTEAADKCDATMVGPDDNLVVFKFEPTPEAVANAQLPPGQTWCDRSTAVMVLAGERLGWTH
ncbi:hypothetical protein MSTE_00009 [Mycobacteroides stephanolepidis]|uniref:Uncharacterized protein n=2 Tax=[Mycobacterium] stephanolepidis TaxID=1520670 RepID=A0A1Z4EQY5_9MYCO|nr:hypothetical protein MSTE_00009 [[Mycobacterium] stephanolepidis]